MGKENSSHIQSRNKNDGIYLIITLEAESLKSGDVENEAKLGTDVLRFMLLQKEG
jgi:ribosomal protein S6